MSKEPLPYKRVNLKLPRSVHAKLRAVCRAEKVPMQKKLAAVVRQFVGLSR